MQNSKEDWATYETTLRRVILSTETSEIKYFAGACAESVLKVVDWYYNDHLADKCEEEMNTVWVYRLVNLNDPKEEILTERPDDWPELEDAIVA